MLPQLLDESVLGSTSSLLLRTPRALLMHAPWPCLHHNSSRKSRSMQRKGRFCCEVGVCVHNCQHPRSKHLLPPPAPALPRGTAYACPLARCCITARSCCMMQPNQCTNQCFCCWLEARLIYYELTTSTQDTERCTYCEQAVSHATSYGSCQSCSDRQPKASGTELSVPNILNKEGHIPQASDSRYPTSVIRTNHSSGLVSITYTLVMVQMEQQECHTQTVDHPTFPDQACIWPTLASQHPLQTHQHARTAIAASAAGCKCA